MKKYIILLFATLILGFVSGKQVKADCPPNWNQGSITFRIGNCWYFANFCYNCGVTGPDPGNIRITKYGKLPGQINCDDSNISIEEVADVMISKIYQYFYENCLIPPCSLGLSKNMIVEYPLCHIYHNRVIRDENGNYKGNYIWWESCNTDFYCQRVVQCCYLEDGTLSCPRISTQIYGQPLFCTPTGSPPQRPILPPEDQDWDSDCFYDTSCK